MTDLEIFGSIQSQPVRTVLMFSRLSNLIFAHHDIDLEAKEHESEEFTALNPHQTIPTISHDGYSLWESAAIIPYLADAFHVDNQWYPKDIKLRGKINAYLHWHHTGTRQPITDYIYVKFVLPILQGAPELNEEQEESQKATINEWFDTFSWLLAETGYIARTQSASVADIFAFNEVSTLFMPLSLIPNPKFQEWMEELLKRPKVKEWYEEIRDITVVKEYTEQLREIVLQMLMAHSTV
jgi:glutathione S-transferase